MNKEETLRRKAERDIKSMLRRQRHDINALRREFYTGNFRSLDILDTNNYLIVSKKKKMDLRLLRYIS